MQDETLQRLLRLAKENPNGFTVRLPHFTPITKGWIVAMKETQNCFGFEGLKKAVTVAEKTTNIVGGWKDGKKWYWDASMVFTDENEATQAGKQNEQIAIYHVETATVKFL